MGTVYVIQQPRPNQVGWMPDLSSATDYGKLEFVFDAHERVYALPGPSRFKATKVLKGFNPEEDYILWPNVGDPAAFAIVMDVIASMDVDLYKMLYWDRKRNQEGKREKNMGFYVPVTVNRKEKRNND